MIKKNRNLKLTSINFGPQHPAAHGVLRLVMHVSGESVVWLDPHIGLLHRGTEKLIENKNLMQALPYFDRLDYVSTLAQEVSYILAIEQLCSLTVTEDLARLRCSLLELTRIQNHLMSITTHALDLGAITPFLWGFEEREKLMSLFEELSGARLHTAFFRPGYVAKNVPVGFVKKVTEFSNRFLKRTLEIDNLLSRNKIWRYRLQNIGLLDKKKIKEFALTGVLARSAGIAFDLRKNIPYDAYSKLNFNVCLGFKGDSLSRYLLRIWEMRESSKLAVDSLGSVKFENIARLNKNQVYSDRTMEGVINHFKFWAYGPKTESASAYCGTESPKGEFGVYLSTNKKTFNPLRCKIRSPGFFSLQALNSMGVGQYVADIVTLIGTVDVVFGEIDR